MINPIPASRPTAPQEVLDLVDLTLHAAGELNRIGDQIAGRHGQTASRSLILGALAGSPGSIADIARRRGLRRQSVQETMGRLEREGLVSRVAASSRRSPTFALTTAGQHLQHALHCDYVEWAAKVAKTLDGAAVHSATLTLTALSRAPGEDASASSVSQQPAG